MAVSVSDGAKVVFSKQYPVHAFHQFVVMPFEPKVFKHTDHALTINGLAHLCSKLSVAVTFSSLTTD